MVLEQSAPRLAKSAERIDGAMMVLGAMVFLKGFFWRDGVNGEKLLVMGTGRARKFMHLLTTLELDRELSGRGRGTPGGPIAGDTPDTPIPAARLVTATDITLLGPISVLTPYFCSDKPVSILNKSVDNS